jgi:glycosyltransferase involved in cell wall biosynthesis
LKKSDQKVLIVSPLFWPSFGGIQQFTEKFLLELLSRGYEVNLLILRSESNKRLVDLHLSTGTRALEIEIGFSLKFFCRYICGYYSKVYFSQFSLRSLYYFFVPVNKVVVISHRDYPVNIEFLKSKLSSLKLMILGLPWVINVAVSRDLARSLPGSPMVIHNRSWREFTFQDVLKSSRRIDLLFVGRLDKDKGLDLLLDIIQRLDSKVGPRLRVTVVGVGPMAPLLESLASKSLQRIQLECHKKLDDVVLQELFLDAKVLIMPSRYEGYGLVGVEALKAGCVLIASDISAIKEATYSQGIYISDNLPEAFVLEVATQLASFKTISQNSWIACRNTFDFRRTVDEYLAIFAE